MTSLSELIKQRRQNIGAAPAAPVEADTSRSYNFTPYKAAEPYMDVVTEAEKAYGLPKNLLPNLIHNESTFNPKAVSSTGAIGIAQIMPKYHPTVDPKDPKASIKYAAKHLRDLYDKFGDWDKAIAAYNTGASNVKKLYDKGELPEETRNYLKNINKAMVSGGNGEGDLSKLLSERRSVISTKESPKSLQELIKDRKKLVTPITEQKLEVPTTAAPPEPSATETYFSKGSAIWNPSTHPVLSKTGFGQKPEGGWDEFGRPLDKVGKPYVKEKTTDPWKINKVVSETLSGLSTIATQPASVMRGVSDFFLSLPAFGVGLIAGASKAGAKLIEQLGATEEPSPDDLAKDVMLPGYSIVKGIDLKKVYDAASEGMMESFEFFEPGKQLALKGMEAGGLISGPAPEGTPLYKDADRLVPEVAMAPLNALAAVGREVAGADVFKDSPNIQGAALFAGDILGLVSMGYLLHGGRGKEFAREIEITTTDARKILDKIRAANEIPDPILRDIQLKLAEIDKKRLEARAKEFADSLGGDLVSIEDAARYAEEIAKAKLRPVAETGIASQMPEGAKPEFTYQAKKSGNKYFKVGDIWYDEKGKEVLSKFRIGALEKGKVEFVDTESNILRADEYYHSPNVRLKLRDQGTVYKDQVFVEKGNDPTHYIGKETDIERINLPNNPKIITLDHLADLVSKLEKISKDDILSNNDKLNDAINTAWQAGYDIVDGGTQFRVVNPDLPRTKVGKVIGKEESRPTGSEVQKVPGVFRPAKGEVKGHKLEVITPSKVEIPKFKGTEDAVAFGEKATPEQVTELKRLRDEAYARGKELRDNKDYQAAMDVNTEGQFYREAVEASEGKHPSQEKKTVKKFKELEPEPDKPVETKVDWFGEGKETKPEPITDLDRQTGTPVPELDNSISMFMESRKKTNALAKIYEERAKQVAADPEIYVQKLINDVRRWFYGEDQVNINEVRNKLSEMAGRADGLRELFMTGVDHLKWKETVSEAANWARKVERGKGVQLNMMIPVNEIPGFVRKTLKDLFGGVRRIATDKLYRNEDLWRRTGFWLGRDGKWRWELDDTGSYFTGMLKVAEDSIVELGEVFHHPKLFRLFPELDNMKVEFKAMDNFYGKFIPDEGFVLNSSMSDAQAKWVVLHEIQHYINDKLGAFKGSTVATESNKVMAGRLEAIAVDKEPWVQEGLLNYAKNLRDGVDISNFYQVGLPFIERNYKQLGLAEGDIKSLKFPTGGKGLYYRNPGEMEARLTQARRKYSAKRRAKIPPWETLDDMLTFEGTPKEVGGRLYSAGAAMGEAVIEGAKKVADYTRKARGMKRIKPDVAVKMLREEFNRSFTDRSGNIRNKLLDKLGPEGYSIIQKMYLSKGAGAYSASMLKQMGKEVYSGLSNPERHILDTVILCDRLIDIAKYKDPKKFRLPKDVTLDRIVAYRELYGQIEKLSPSRIAEIETRAKAYFEWMKKPLKDLLDAGLISQAEYDRLISHNYRRLESVVNIFDSKYRSKLGGRKRTVYDSGIESLQRGRETDIYEPSSEVMALEVFNRSYGRILNNEANKSLLELAKRDPENPFVRVKAGKDSKVPSGWQRIYMYDQGKRKAIYLSPEFAREWIVNAPEITYKFANILRYASGSPVLRTFATGINWGFALANLPRDIMHTWFTARVYEGGKWKGVYNPNAPVFAMQMGADLARVFTDAATRGKRYQAYIAEGGGMEFLVHQGRLFQRGRHIKGPLDGFLNFMGYFGETSEIMTRLAIRDRVIRKRARQRGISFEEASRNKDITREATFAARDYMDFGQGGGIAKAMDNFIPYLNASIQGTRGLVRSFKPGSGSSLSSTYKLSQLAAITTGVYLVTQFLTPQTFKNLKGNIDMQNNLCLPIGDEFGFLDENGQQRYMYFKIPLDPGQKFFKTFFEAATDKWMGNEVDVDRVTEALTTISPVGISSLPPTFSGVMGYMQNKDYWLNEDIWKQTDKPFDYPLSKEEYIPGKTPQAYIDIGQATGLSPERLRYAVEELTTSGTVWSYLAGRGYDEAFGDLPKSKKEQHLAMVLSKMPVVKRFFGVTNPYSKHASKMSEVEQTSVLKDFVESRGMDTLIDQYLVDGTATRNDLVKYAKSFKDIDTFDRLMDRYYWEKAIQDLPEKSFWRRMKGLNTDAKAKLFVDRLNESNPEERKQLWNEFRIIDSAGGVISDSFVEEVAKYKKQLREGKVD